MTERVLNTQEGLAELKDRLERAASVAAGAHLCAVRGANAEARQMILELDVDLLLHEAQSLLAMLTMRRILPASE